MSLLVRKINRNNWPSGITNSSDIKADAITNCMRTSHDSMSVYEISSKADIDNAFLAIASNFDRLETFDVVMMDKKVFIDSGINVLNNPGLTPVKDLKNTHWDISDLRYANLGTIAQHINSCVSSNNVMRRSRGELKNIIEKAITDGRLKLNTLRERLQQELS